MAVRNFYLEATIDGRKGELKGGPRGKDGGFELTIKMRSKGEITDALIVRGTAMRNKLFLSVKDAETEDKRYTLTITTER